jgi:hypothetical protein
VNGGYYVIMAAWMPRRTSRRGGCQTTQLTTVGKKELYRMIAEHYAQFFKGVKFDETLDTTLGTTEENAAGTV